METTSLVRIRVARSPRPGAWVPCSPRSRSTRGDAPQCPHVSSAIGFDGEPCAALRTFQFDLDVRLATRAIDLNGSLEAAWKQMAAKGVKRIQSADIAAA